MQQLHTFGGNDDLLQELINARVRFLVIGGLAVKFYAQQREADDLDLLLEQSPENADQIFQAFAALKLNPGFPKELISSYSKHPQHLPLKAVHYADLVTRPELDFQGEWDASQEGLIGQNRVRFASLNLLTSLKTGSDREKDFLDLGHPNVFAVDLPSPPRICPGSSNKGIRSRQARSILIR